MIKYVYPLIFKNNNLPFYNKYIKNNQEGFIKNGKKQKNLDEFKIIKDSN